MANRYFVWEDWDAIRHMVKNTTLTPIANPKRALVRNYICVRDYKLRYKGKEQLFQVKIRKGDWVVYAEDIKHAYRACRAARKEINIKRGDRDIVRPMLPQTSYDMIQSTIFDYWDAIDHFESTKGFGNVGLILAGPPGVGKTETMRWISEVASRKGRQSHKIGYSDLQSILAKGQELSTNSMVLLIDDIDVGLLRDRRCEDAYNDLTAPFLTSLDGLSKREGRVIVVSTNEKLDKIDPALTRPGRLEHRLNYEYPTMDLVEAFLVDRDIDASLFEGWSFARIDMFLNKFKVAEYMRQVTLKGFYEQFIYEHGEEDETVVAYSGDTNDSFDL